MRIIKLEIEVESTATDEELKETLTNTLEFCEPGEPDDTGTTIARIRNIEIGKLEE
jgi:hypothetical protein